MRLVLLGLLGLSCGTIAAADSIAIPGGQFAEWGALGTLCAVVVFLITRTIPQLVQTHANSLQERDAVLHEMAEILRETSANCAARAEQFRKLDK